MYKGKRVIHIVAAGLNGEIGCNNDLLWKLPEDMQFFKQTTIGNVCIAGRKTVDSFPAPLERRIVVTVTRKDGASFLEDALISAWNWSNNLNTDCIYIIGGQSIYEQTESIADELLMTRVHENFNHADAFYRIPEGMELVSKTEDRYKTRANLLNGDGLWYNFCHYMQITY